VSSVAGVNSPNLLHRTAADSAYILLGFPLAVATFVVLVPAFSLSLGLLPLAGLGVFVGAGTMLLARVFADLERLRLNPASPRRPIYRQARHGRWAKAGRILGDLQSWLDLAHGILGLPIAIFTFVVVVTWWALTLSGITYFLWDWAIPRGDQDQGLPELLGYADTAFNRITINTTIGLFALLTLPLITRACAALKQGFSQALLMGIAQLRHTIADLKDQRAAAVSAEATALRKLERDIHDGPQQRLVRLAMDISRARQQLDNDPDQARSTLDEALGQTRETLDELRSLSRGIAPPILSDRGLPAALTAIAGRSAIPVDLAVDPSLETQRPQPEIENAAYFVAAEALVNAAKHSNATRCELTVVRAAKTVGVSIVDDGQGGAHISKGHGLAGLTDRVRAAGGTLTVTSPPGGPTEVRAELPE
jgi:signal transduction histidine kinase